MTGIPEIDHLFLFGFGGIILLIVLIVGVFVWIWKFDAKVPQERRSKVDRKLQYFMLAMVIISYLVSIFSGDFRHASTASFVIAIFFLGFMAYLYFFKKLKQTLPQILFIAAVSLYSLFTIVVYFLK